MPSFTKKGHAEAQENIGKSQVAWAKHGEDAMGMTLSNKDRISLAKEGVKNQIEARMKLTKMRAAQSTDDSQ